MMDLAALALALAGFAALALSMHKHHRDIVGTAPTFPRRLALRVAGWLLLGLSLAFCVAPFGWAIGLVHWTGLLTVAGVTIALVLAAMTTRIRRRTPGAHS